MAFQRGGEAPVAQWVNHWPTDIADRVRSLLEAKSSQPETGSIAHSLSLSTTHRPDMTKILLKKTYKSHVFHPYSKGRDSPQKIHDALRVFIYFLTKTSS